MKRLTSVVGVAAAALVVACSGSGADYAPVFYDTSVTVVPTDDDLHRLLRGADEQWEGVGVRPDFITVAPPGPVGADETVVMWSTVEELSAMWGERGVVGGVYRAGRMVFIARDVPSELYERIAVHELGHLLAPDRDDLPCHGDPSVGMMCDGAGAARPTDADLVWICDSPTNPCNDNNPQN